MSAPVCPVCRHPTRRHDDTGCLVPDCATACDQTRATLAGLDELPPAEPLLVPPPPPALLDAQPTPPPGRPRQTPVSADERFYLNLSALGGELQAILRRVGQQRREPTAAEREKILELQTQIRFIKQNGGDIRITEDSPAGADGVPGVAHRPGTNLPGTSPAPVESGHEEAAPPAADPAAEAETPLPAPAAGLIAFGTTHLCPDLHARCHCAPVRWRVLLERIADA